MKKDYAIINYIALLGWSPKGEEEKFTMDELIEKFSISGLSKKNYIKYLAPPTWLTKDLKGKELSL